MLNVLPYAARSRPGPLPRPGRPCPLTPAVSNSVSSKVAPRKARAQPAWTPGCQAQVPDHVEGALVPVGVQAAPGLLQEDVPGRVQAFHEAAVQQFGEAVAGSGVGKHSDVKYGGRFGEGTLAGRRALLSVTVGGPELHYAGRGINGPIDDLLFPIHHGILYYPGIEVLPPFVLYGTDRATDEDFPDIAKAWKQRLLTLESTEPIAFRRQNFGDHEIPSLHLKKGLEPAGRSGFALHVQS